MTRQASVKIGGAWKQAKAINVKVGGAWKQVKYGLVKSGGTWLEFFAGYFYEPTMTVGTTAGQNGFLDSEFAFPYGSMSSVSMSGVTSATLRGLMTDFNVATLNIYIGGGAGPNGSYTDPGADYIKAIQVGSFPEVVVGDDYYQGTSYTAGAYRRWWWNTSNDQNWVSGANYAVKIR